MSPKKKILLVEDDKALAQVYTSRLQLEGFDVKHVLNGEDALSTALFVLGPPRGMALADSLPEVEALIVFSDRDELQWQATSVLRKKLEIFSE